MLCVNRSAAERVYRQYASQSVGLNKPPAVEAVSHVDVVLHQEGELMKGVRRRLCRVRGKQYGGDGDDKRWKEDPLQVARSQTLG